MIFSFPLISLLLFTLGLTCCRDSSSSLFIFCMPPRFLFDFFIYFHVPPRFLFDFLFQVPPRFLFFDCNRFTSGDSSFDFFQCGSSRLGLLNYYQDMSKIFYYSNLGNINFFKVLEYFLLAHVQILFCIACIFVTEHPGPLKVGMVSTIIFGLVFKSEVKN